MSELKVMKNQVLSIEQMQKLKELGVDTSKASMRFEKMLCWVAENKLI